MYRYKALLGLGLLAFSLEAGALLEDQNHFALDKSGTACALRLEPQRDALNVAFTAPDTLVVQSSYEFIAGSAIKLSFDDGSEVRLPGLPSSSSRRISATIPADKMAGFSTNAHVKVGSDSIRGPLFRRISLAGFKDGYAELAGCAAK
ncbi:MAG: hypothetical protein ACREVL_14920 [Solimonas sp.]